MPLIHFVISSVVNAAAAASLSKKPRAATLIPDRESPDAYLQQTALSQTIAAPEDNRGLAANP
jgi:hypothetical protein